MSPWLFWGLLTGMIVMALGFVLWPLLRSARQAETSRRQTNIVLYRERLDEIARSVAAGELGVADAAEIRQELDLRLLEEAAPAANPGMRTTATGSRGLVMMLLLIVPALAIGIYLANGDWRLALVGDSEQALPLLLDRLQRHLQEQPDDVEALRLLATSQAQLGQHALAARNFSQLNRLAATPDSLVGEAEATALAAGGKLQGRPTALIEQALQSEPQHARGLWYAGLAARQRGQDADALRHWLQLAGQTLPDDFRGLLNTQIREVGGSPPATPEPLRIVLKLKLDPALTGRVTADMPVFVYARAPGQDGPPLAAIRKQVSELPLTVVLDDAASMLAERKLSSVDRWRVTARIARQGSAQTQSGDLLGQVTVTRAQLTQTIELTIDNISP